MFGEIGQKLVVNLQTNVRGLLNLATQTTGILPAASLPNPTSSTLGGIQSYAAVTNQWINTISTSGVPSSTQPAFTNISGTVAAAQLPNPSSSTLGGVQSAAAVSHQWINSISTSGVPALSQPAFTDISGSVAAAQLPNPTSSTLGGVQSYAAVSNQWINTISTSGVPSSTQPAFSNISGQATLAQFPTIADGTIISNISGGSTTPSANTITTVLDKLGSTQGQVLYRNATAWVPLAVGSNGQVLTSGGAAANLSWTTASGGYSTIDNQGSAVTQQATLNFTGAGVLAVNNSGSSRTDVIINDPVAYSMFGGV